VTTDLAAIAAGILARVRSRRPLVHQITNAVVMNDSANVTLCLGASPVMATAPEEVSEMISQADALVLNLGTLTAESLEAMLIAADRANFLGRPVVLDPVGVGATRFRTAAARRIVKERRIAVIRGNAGEIGILADAGGQVRGVDAVGAAEPAEVTRALTQLARREGLVVAVTGARDLVTDGRRLLAVDNGHQAMVQITGSGCMATTVVACCLAVEPDPVLAAAAGLAAFGVAGELAAAVSQGPGSFRVALFDCLAALSMNPDELARAAHIANLTGQVD
jgi:hydroxyethylthiazole kinase